MIKFLRFGLAAISILALLMAISIASPFIPQGDIDLRGAYGIQNATEINVTTLNATTIYSPSIDSLNTTKLNITDQRFNDTAINTSDNIKGLGFNLTAELNNLYYSISNPSSFISSVLSGVFTATELNGSINWTWIQNYPQACPAGSFLTAVNDTNTCVVPENVSVTASNITSGTLSDQRLSSNITQINTTTNMNVLGFNITTQLKTYFDSLYAKLAGIDASNISSGTLPNARLNTTFLATYNWSGYTNLSGGTDNGILIGNTTSGAFGLKTMVDCADGTNSKVLYNYSNMSFYCGADQTGAPGSGDITEVNTTTDSGLQGGVLTGGANLSINRTLTNLWYNFTFANPGLVLTTLAVSLNTTYLDTLYAKLTGISASNITTGTISDARLSSNVSLITNYTNWSMMMNFPTNCTSGKYISGIGNTSYACSTPSSSSTYDVSNEYNHHYYSKETGFESFAAGYNTPWVSTGIASGAPTLAAGTRYHPGLVYVSTSTSASSGHCFQITGASTYLLSPNYTTQLTFKPMSKTGNWTNIRFGFMDIFTTAAVTDGVFFNITQAAENSSYFNITGMSVNNSVIANTPTYYNATNNTWYSAEIYIYSNTNATFILYNESGSLLWTGNTTTRIPQTTGRETSHAVCAFTQGLTTTQILAYYDFMSVGINETLVR